MRILYIDLSPGWGGSLVSLERLVGRLDRTAFEPVVLLAARNPGRAHFEALGLRVVTVPTFAVESARSTALVQYFKGTSVGQRVHGGPDLRTPDLRGLGDLEGLCGGQGRRLWVWGRGVRDFLTRTLPLTARLTRVIRTIQPDLVHVNDAIFVNRPAIAAAWLARTPAICHARSLGHLGAWDHRWARTLRGMIAISQWVADDVATQGVHIARQRVIYDGVELGEYTHAPDQAAARRALGLPPAAPVVAVLGRLVPWKGQDLFLRAMRQVADALPEVIGLIAGEPESFSLAFGPALHALADELGLAQTVHFLGFVRDTQPVIAAADLLAHTSTSPEPFGLVMLEAMALSRPVVTPAEGGGPEIVTDGVTGSLYPPRDAAALAEAILRILQDQPAASALGAAGRVRVAEAFSLASFVTEMAQFYQEVAGR